MDKLNERTKRAEQVNDLLLTISSCGREFFRAGDIVSRFEVQQADRIFYVDKFRERRIWTHNRYWTHTNKITEGGTLKQLLGFLKQYVMTGDKVPSVLGPWPDWVCGGDLWGYGYDMQAIRDKASELGLTETRAGSE